MTEREINLITGLLALIAVLVVIWVFGCGIDQSFKEIRPNYFYNTQQPGNLIIEDLIASGIDEYNIRYGACTRKVYITTKNWIFKCGEVSAHGCNIYNLVQIGVNPTSECLTLQALFHELSHACRGLADCYQILRDGSVYTPPDCWSNEISLFTIELQGLGKCISGTEDLYSPYVWGY